MAQGNQNESHPILNFRANNPAGSLRHSKTERRRVRFQAISRALQTRKGK